MEGKVVAITGGASGIGLALAKLLALRGAKVSISDVNEANLLSAKQAIKEAAPNSTDVLTHKCDVRHFSDIQQWLQYTVDTFGKLDGAANIAGTFGALSPLEDVDEQVWDFVMDVNLKGTLLCMKAEAKHLTRGGSIVNMSSIQGLRPSAGHYAYAASKHGVVGITRVAAVDCGPKGIRVNAVAPGLITTPMLKIASSNSADDHLDKLTKSMPIQREADPTEVAKVMAFLLNEEESSFVTGAVYSVDGGWNI